MPELTPLTIAIWDDPILSTKCEPVDKSEFGVELETLGKQMLLSMGGNGIGLAAPQVGLAKRLFVMKCQDGEEIIVVNPQLTISGEYKVTEEGCLSLPSINVMVCRQQDCLLRYQEPLTGKEYTVELHGLDAVCAQHENDHTLGILIIDRTTKHFKKAALKQLKAGNARRLSGKAR